MAKTQRIKKDFILTTEMQDGWLLRNLVTHIKSKHLHALTVINRRVLTLFWEIGTGINHYVRAVGAKQNKSLVREALSEVLQPQFGPFFTMANLRLMERLARKFTLEDLRQLSSCISWKYIPLFLSLKNQEDRIGYAKLIYQESLSPLLIKKKIAENSITKPEAIEEDVEHHLWTLIRSKDYKDAPGFREYFDGPKAEAFRLLFEPKLLVPKVPDSISGKDHMEIIATIYSKIIDFQLGSNKWLNSWLNFVFRDIGSIVSQSFDESGRNDEKERLVALSELVKQQLGDFFDEEWLHTCMLFYERYKGVDAEGSEFAMLVRWEHIKLLLNLEDKGARLFYARYILEKGLSTAALKELIDQDFYTKEIVDKDLVVISTVQVMPERRSKEGKVSIIVRTTSIEEQINPDNDLNRNSYKNPDILAFLKAVQNTVQIIAFGMILWLS